MNILPRYTMEEALALLQQMRFLMDEARIVDPADTEVLELDENGAVRTGRCSCFDAWSRDRRCDNCTSMQTIVDGVRKSKYQIIGDKAHYVVSWPIILVENGKERPVVLEIIMKAADLLLEQEGGAQALKKQLKEARIRLHQDELTQVYNRRYLNDFAFLYRRQNHVAKRIGLIMLDLRKFKEINDTQGHTAGDEILRKVAAALQGHVRAEDSVIRYGGDEFVVILTGCGAEIMPRKVEELRAAIAPVADGNFGWSHTDDFVIKPEFLEAMIHEADAMMYEEKKARGGGR